MMKTVEELSDISDRAGKYIIDRTNSTAEIICVVAIMTKALNDTIAQSAFEQINKVRSR